MDVEQLRTQTRPSSGEAPFRLNEVFFSRTDERGVIRTGNYVFRRVANYDWSDLAGAPHKIIRHPDMPKGVFRFFWDTIKRGEIMGAYVKNRAKDGLYYWVFAVVVPCEGGFLSARIKPSSELLTTVEGLYAEQRRLEKEQDLDPEASAAWLLDRLKDEGFADYGRFMAHALTEELNSRDRILERPADDSILRFRKMQKAADDLTEVTEDLIGEFEMSAIIPHNMRVIASRIEPEGGPISTLSANYGGMAREMSSWFESNVVGENSNFSKIRGTVAQSQFMKSMSRILHECVYQLEFERQIESEFDLHAEKRHLEELAAEYSARSDAGQHRIAEETHRILEACKVMKRHMLGLSTSRVMCKIESARLLQGRESLTDTISELNGFQERIRAKADRIEHLSGDIRGLLS